MTVGTNGAGEESQQLLRFVRSCADSFCFSRSGESLCTSHFSVFTPSALRSNNLDSVTVFVLQHARKQPSAYKGLHWKEGRLKTG